MMIATTTTTMADGGDDMTMMHVQSKYPHAPAHTYTEYVTAKHIHDASQCVCGAVPQCAR